MLLHVALAASVVLLLAFYRLYRSVLNPSVEEVDLKRFPKKYEPATETSDFYDAVIVGAGPAGASAAYYLAKGGKKVLLLEKKKFPRDKICGDAVCKTGIEILSEMGVYKELVANGKTHVAEYGGLVSPGGLSYVGHSKEYMGEIPAAVAIKRMDMDEAIARAAQGAGANLMENMTVQDAVFDDTTGLWTVIIEDSELKFKGRVLLCADGSTSKLGTQLGIVKGPPTGTCSRAYIEGGTHRFKADGVMFFPPGLLPGYAVLLRHPKDEVNYCIYIIPGNPKLSNDDLSYWHHYMLEKDPNVSRAVGKTAKLERMKAGSLRIGGEPITYGKHVLLIGDAAGFVDPMTGEGIHTALDSGRIAAHFLCEAIAVGNFDKEVMKEYQNRWLKAFGMDFKWSHYFVQLMYRYPIFMDAFTAAIIRKGDKFLARWGDIMTGRAPKANLLRPEYIVVIGFELCVLLVKKLFGGYGSKDKKVM